MPARLADRAGHRGDSRLVWYAELAAAARRAQGSPQNAIRGSRRASCGSMLVTSGELTERREARIVVISEGSRRTLHAELVRALGEEAADVLMEHLPPSGWADVATKQDIDHLTTVMNLELGIMRAELHSGLTELGATLRAELTELGTSLRTDNRDLETSLRAEFHSGLTESGATLRAELTELGTSLRTDNRDLGTSLRTDNRDLGTSLRAEMLAMSSDVHQQTAGIHAEINSLHCEINTIYGAINKQFHLMIAIAGVLLTGFGLIEALLRWGFD